MTTYHSWPCWPSIAQQSNKSSCSKSIRGCSNRQLRSCKTQLTFSFQSCSCCTNCFRSACTSSQLCFVPYITFERNLDAVCAVCCTMLCLPNITTLATIHSIAFCTHSHTGPTVPLLFFVTESPHFTHTTAWYCTTACQTESSNKVAL